MWRLDYIYYRICDFYKKKKDSSAEQTSMAVISLIETAVVIDIFIFLNAVFDLVQLGEKTKFWILPIYFGFIIFNWRKYLSQRKYRELHNNWKNEDSENRKRNGIYVLIAIIIPIILPILFALIKHNILGSKSFW